MAENNGNNKNEKDYLLECFFDPRLWEEVIEKGIDKSITTATLKQLCTVEKRIEMLTQIIEGKYVIAPPHTAQIPKDTPGEFRTVYINDDIDRVFLAVVNNMLFEQCGHMVHPNCKSYQKGIGTGKVVREVADRIQCSSNGKQIGFISDLSKYFDSVSIEWIDVAFDHIEKVHGKSKIIDIVRAYYHSDACYDLNGNLIEHYQSLKQGCAVASFLADCVLYLVDITMTEKAKECNGIYVRYSDDILYIGENYEEAFQILKEGLNYRGLTLNPKKVKPIDDSHWFKFLGFNIKGNQITLSKKRIKTFQKEIAKRTYKSKKRKSNDIVSYEYALRSVNNFLYKGDGEHSWATGVLGIINVEKDIAEMNRYVMDCLRFNLRGKNIKGKGDKLIGGLGVVDGDDYTIVRGTGSWVKTNKESTDEKLIGYRSMQEMRNALIYTRFLYDTLVREM